MPNWNKVSFHETYTRQSWFYLFYNPAISRLSKDSILLWISRMNTAHFYAIITFIMNVRKKFLRKNITFLCLYNNRWTQSNISDAMRHLFRYHVYISGENKENSWKTLLTLPISINGIRFHIFYVKLAIDNYIKSINITMIVHESSLYDVDSPILLFHVLRTGEFLCFQRKS